MNLRSKRTIAIAATAALAAVGGGVAYAATNAADPRDEILSDAAQRLNVSPDELRSALQGAFEDQIDDAVSAGRLTEQQGERAKQMLRRHGVPLGGPGGPGGHGDRVLHVRGPIGPGIDAAADYLGLTRAQLGRQLANGRTLAEIARAQGKSVDGLEDAIVAAAKSELDRAVADGDLTAGERDQMLERLREHVGDLVAGELPAPPPGGPGGPGPHIRRFDGPPPGGPGFDFRGDERGSRSGGQSD